jgi:3-hydroxybutyrate dehydrogenase
MSSITQGRVHFESADLTNPTVIENMMSRISEKFGGVDILVNNAGIQYISPVEEFPVEKWDQIISLNLSASFHTSRLVIPYMREKGWGRIINIASVHGLVGSNQKAAYVAAKHGIIGLTKVIGLETAEVDITCNAICPGWVLTPLVEKQIRDRAAIENISYEQASSKLLFEKQPSLKFAKPEDIGTIALFLCGKGSEQITGTTLTADGGWTAR